MNRILSASTLKGTDVKNRNNENIGKIKDLMVNTEDGHVEYAVLSFGGFLGIGDKFFAVPIQALQFSTKDDDHIITLDMDKKKLEKAPGFDKDNWPMTANTEFIESVYNYYGYERPRKLVRK